MNESHRPERGRVARDLLLLLVLWLGLFVRHSGLEEFRREEGRRTLPAREMVDEGQFVVPTVFRTPYLTKPPLMYWSVAAAESVFDPIEPFTSRVPSLVATLATVLLIYAFLSRHGTPREALYSSLVFLITPMVFEKGTLAEIEALLALLIFGSIATNWMALRGSRRWLLVSALALGLAVLTKGPVAWVFHGGAMALLSLAHRDRRPVVTGLLVLALSALVAAPWVAFLLQRLDWEVVRATWLHESTGGGSGFGASVYLEERVKFVLGIAFGFLPASLVLAGVLLARGREWLRSDLAKLALAAAGGGVLFFLVYPYSRARYAYPSAPWVAVAGGVLLARASLARGAQDRIARFAVRGFCALSVLLAILIPIAGGLELAGHGKIPIPISAAGWGVLGLVAAAGAGAAWALRRGARTAALASAFACILLGRVFYLEHVLPAEPSRHGVNERATRLAAALPESATHYTTHYGSFNVFARLDRFLRLTDDPWGTVHAGERLVTTPQDIERLGLLDEPGWRSVADVAFEDEQELIVLERGGAAEGEE